MRDKRKRGGFVFIITGLLLIAAALCLTVYNIWDGRRAEASVRSAYVGVESIIAEKVWENRELEESAEVWYPDYVLNPDMEMPETEIDGQIYIGVLNIPALELSLPVISQWSYPGLKIAPCRYMGSAYQNDMIIAAHNYASHFGNIGSFDIGDEVTFTDMDGNVFTYQVAEVEVLAPTAIEEMTSGDWALTLFTCTIGGKSRVTVRCEEIEK